MSSDPETDVQRRLAAIVEASTDATICTDLTGIITSWDRGAERLFGYAAAAAVGQSIRLVIPPEQHADEDAVLRRIQSGQTVDRHDTTLLDHGGRRIPVSLAVSPIAMPSGEVVGGVMTARDLIDTHRLERDAQHFAAIVASSDDAIISKDLDGTVVSWNGAAERLFGYTAPEMIGRSIRTIIPPDRQGEEDEVLRRIRRGDGVDHFETLRLHKDGTRIPISLTVSPIRSRTGTIIGASKIARDLRRTQGIQFDALRLAAIVESSDDAIVGKNLDGIVTSWNRGAELMFGYSAAQMVGQSIRRLIPADRQQEEDDVLSRIRRGDRVDHYETIRVRQDGSLVPVSLTVSPIRNAAGTVIGASKIARDIGERQRADHERQRLLKIARDASQLKDEFLATLSHELRTPLNAIVGYLRMMQAGLLDPDKQSRAVDTVVRNAGSLTQIVEDVLDVSRIISGKLRLDVQAIHLATLIDETIETIRPAADAKDIRVSTIVDPRAAPVSGDPERMRQILWNLFSNAVKFTNRGGRVEVRLERVNSHVELSVTDTGIGIPLDFLPHVFDRFRQADASAARERGGLGLGLAISRHLVELQGGKIFVNSDGPGTGSTFRVEFPIRSVFANDPSGPREHPQTSVGHGAIAVPRLEGTRILAVDDERDALALIREILEATGATVTTADSTDDALEKLSRTRIDVLVADLGMPRMDGFALIQRIRQSDDPHIRAIPAAALTAFARSEDRTRALRSGFQMHLSKPIEPGELMAAAAMLARLAQVRG